jgi:ABC-type uncharacterized transport system substrate-binding protein
LRARRFAVAGTVASAVLLAACGNRGPVPVESAPIEPASAEPPVQHPPLARAPDTVETPEPTSDAVPPPRPRILVLRSSDAASYADVAAALERLLGERFELDQRHLDEESRSIRVDDREAGGWVAAVAIGAGAAEAVDTELDIPTVFCQVLDHASLVDARDTLYGVEALPPLEMQLRTLRRVAPGVTSVGAFLASDETALADAAGRAATENGLKLHVEYAGSDRELLYRFRRLASSIDALWLLPSPDILSPGILREVLELARGRGVHSVVFDEALLDWGGLLSVGSDSADVAATVAGVVGTLVDADAPAPPRVTPLTAVKAEVNGALAAAFGIEAPARFTQGSSGP